MDGFRDFRGKWAIRNYPKTPSTVLERNAMTTLDSGQVVPATSADGKLLGIGQKDVFTSSDDYTLANNYPVLIPVDGDCTIVGALNLPLAPAQVGTFIDLLDAKTADTSSTSEEALAVVSLITDELGEFKIAQPLHLA